MGDIICNDSVAGKKAAETRKKAAGTMTPRQLRIFEECVARSSFCGSTLEEIAEVIPDVTRAECEAMFDRAWVRVSGGYRYEAERAGYTAYRRTTGHLPSITSKERSR